MAPHPEVAGRWALNGLERAIRNLGDGEAERRVRRQFHQLISALEHDGVYGLASESPLTKYLRPANSSEVM